MTPEQQAIIISQTARGATTRDIEPIAGLDHSTIARAQNQLRPLINAEIQALLTEGLTASRATIIRLAKQGSTTEDKDWAKLALDASKTVLNVAGLTGQPSTIINQLINVNADNGAQATMATLQEFLKAKIGQSTGVTQVHTPELTSQTSQVVDLPSGTPGEADHPVDNSDNVPGSTIPGR